MKKLVLFALSLFYITPAFTQITVAGATPNQGLSLLIGGNLQWNLVSSQGNANQFGTFAGINSNIGFTSGMVLSTAAIDPPDGFAPPNFLMGAGTAGYPPLGNLIGGAPTFNASVVTFQFTPIGDTIQFRYVFASDEYPNFVCSNFNDVFGFLLSGPNPAGGNYVNHNIALIPGSGVPVTINNVNDGNNGPCQSPQGGNCPCNAQYFVNNYSPNQGTVAINGFTVPLTAMAPVVPCSTYTITLAVADVSDGSLNSAVFLEANSFMSPVVTLNPTASIGGVDTVLYEGCSYADIEIIRNYDLNLPHTYSLEITGTAVDGQDYTGLPSSVFFAPGDTSETITLTTIDNPASNSNSTVTITIHDTVCASANGIITSVLTLDIINIDTLEVEIGPDILTCDTVNIESAVTGGLAPYTYDWNTGQFTTPDVVNHVINASQTFVVEVQDNCNHVAYDTLEAVLQSSPTAFFTIMATATSVNEECGTVDIAISRSALLDQARVYPIQISGTATPTADYTVPTTAVFGVNQNATLITLTPVWDQVPEGMEYVTLTMVDTLCNGTLVYDSVRIEIRNIDALALDAGPDLSTGCPILPQTMTPTPTGGTQPYAWEWNTGGTTQNAVAQPESTTVYTVTLTDSCGNTATDDIQIETYYPPVAGFTFSSTDWCEPSIVKFENTTQNPSGDIDSYAWLFGNGESTDGPEPTTLYTTDGTYEVILVVTNSYGCVDSVAHTVTVRPKPTADFYWTPNNPNVNNPDVTFNDNSTTTITHWLWQIGNETSSNEENPMYSFTVSGEYEISLVVTNEFGCMDTARQTVVVTDVSTVYIPSAFTPTNDNLNETFRPYMTNMTDYRIQIYNRWGELLYSSQHADDKGWTGRTPKGLFHKSDVYVYKIYLKDIYGKEFEYYGHVQLMGGM